MKINKQDTVEYNVSIFHEKQKKFIFNKYKNAKKTGKQIIPIENPDLINVLKTYLSTRKNNEYLLMRNEEGLDKKDIENIMRDETGKNYNLPTGTRALRHLFGSNIVVDRPVNPRKLEWYSTQMGTSTKELLNHYADYKENLKSESKTNKKEKKKSLSSDEEEMEYIPEETVTRSGRKSRKTN